MFHTLHVSYIIKRHIFITICCSHTIIYHLKTNVPKTYQFSTLTFLNQYCIKAEHFS